MDPLTLALLLGGAYFAVAQNREGRSATDGQRPMFQAAEQAAAPTFTGQKVATPPPRRMSPITVNGVTCPRTQIPSPLAGFSAGEWRLIWQRVRATEKECLALKQIEDKVLRGERLTFKEVIRRQVLGPKVDAYRDPTKIGPYLEPVEQLLHYGTIIRTRMAYLLRPRAGWQNSTFDPLDQNAGYFGIYSLPLAQLAAGAVIDRDTSKLPAIREAAHMLQQMRRRYHKPGFAESMANVAIGVVGNYIEDQTGISVAELDRQLQNLGGDLRQALEDQSNTVSGVGRVI